MKKIALILTIACSAAFAHDGATGVIKERMDSMKMMGKSNKALSSIARGRSEFDLTLVQTSAATIAEQSGQHLLDLFPEGSLDESSDAKPEIWQQWEKFTTLANDLNTSALELSQIGSEEEFTGAFKAMASSCGGCHKVFRVKK